MILQKEIFPGQLAYDCILIDYFSFSTINDGKIMPFIKFKHFTCLEFFMLCFPKIDCISFFSLVRCYSKNKAKGPALMILLLGDKRYQECYCLHIRIDALGAKYNSSVALLSLYCRSTAALQSLLALGAKYNSSVALLSLYCRSTVAPNCIRFGV